MGITETKFNLIKSFTVRGPIFHKIDGRFEVASKECEESIMSKYHIEHSPSMCGRARIFKGSKAVNLNEQIDTLNEVETLREENATLKSKLFVWKDVALGYHYYGDWSMQYAEARRGCEKLLENERAESRRNNI